jgi:lysophospholipase L1-like esterase
MKNIIISILFALLLALPAKLAAQEGWRGDIEQFRRADSITAPAQGGILFVGSSTFRMWDNFADYFPNYAITKRGFGGSALSDVLYYYEYLVKPYAPKQVIVYEGDNELSNDNASVDEFVDNVKCFVRLTQICFPACDICFVSVKPSPARQRWAVKSVEANRRVKALCEQGGDKLHFIDFWLQVADDKGNLKSNENYYLDDRLHLNAAGYRLLAKTIMPYLVK